MWIDIQRWHFHIIQYHYAIFYSLNYLIAHFLVFFGQQMKFKRFDLIQSIRFDVRPNIFRTGIKHSSPFPFCIFNYWTKTAVREKNTKKKTYMQSVNKYTFSIICISKASISSYLASVFNESNQSQFTLYESVNSELTYKYLCRFSSQR